MLWIVGAWWCRAICWLSTSTHRRNCFQHASKHCCRLCGRSCALCVHVFAHATRDCGALFSCFFCGLCREWRFELPHRHQCVCNLSPCWAIFRMVSAGPWLAQTSLYMDTIESELCEVTVRLEIPQVTYSAHAPTAKLRKLLLGCRDDCSRTCAKPSDAYRQAPLDQFHDPFSRDCASCSAALFLLCFSTCVIVRKFCCGCASMA